MNVNDESDMDCSDAFSLVSADNSPDVGDDDEPYLMVTSPSEGDMAVAGDEYTVEWDYDNGVGSTADRFAIDLYMSEGTGDCGTYYAALCDKPSIGCKDSSKFKHNVSSIENGRGHGSCACAGAARACVQT